MENCPKCGADRPQNAVECPQCGIIYARYEGKLAEAKRAQEQARREMLTTCRACGAEISKNAASCPHCGEPTLTPEQTAKKIQDAELEKTKKQGKNTVIGCLTIFIVSGLLTAYLFQGQEKYEGTGGGSAQYPGQFQVRPDTIGCPSLENYTKLARLARDIEAFKKQLHQSVLTGECNFLPVGKNAFLEDTRLRDDAARVRVQGETTSYWIALNLAK